MIHRILHPLLAVLSGLLLSLAFPAINLEPVAFIALVPLLAAVRGSISGSRSPTFCPGTKQPSMLRSFMLGLITGIVFFGIFLFWVAGIRLYQVPQWLLVIGWIAAAGIFALFIGIFAICVRMIPLTTHFSFLKFIAPAAIWTSLELIRSHFPLGGSPWGILGYSQYQNLILIQIAEFTGVFGVSFLIVLVNTAIAEVISRAKGSWSGIGIAAVAVTLSLLWGGVKLRENFDTGKPLTMAVIQTNIGIDQSWEWDTTREKILCMLDRLTKKAAKSNPDLIIWTETAILSSPETSSWIKTRLASILKGINSCLLVGAPHMTGQPQGVAAASVVNTDYYNSAFLISRKGKILDRYDKIHLVPFGEMLPGEKIFPALRKILPQAGLYSQGKRYTVFKEPCRFCTLICYEGIFGGLTRMFVKNGAQLIVNISNDAWTRTKASYYQHFSMDVFRCVENRRYFIRAGNTGISAIINPAGRIEHLLDVGREGIIIGHIFSNSRLTFYSRFGDVFAWLCLLIAMGYLIAVRKYESVANGSQV